MISVSIVVPVYNKEPYLRECLDSLLAQTLKSVEIIAVDDASTDNSPDILRRYESEHPNVIVISHDVNKKPGGARNTGLMAAQGEYIAYVDSDDKIDPTMYEKMYAKARESDADIADCDYYNWYPGDRDRLKPKKSIDIDDCGVLDREKRARLVLRGGLPVPTKIFKRKFLLDNDILYPENLLYAEDSAIGSLGYIYANVLEKVPEHLYYYRHDNASITRENQNMQVWNDKFEASVLFADAFVKRGLYQEYKDEVDARFIRIFYIESLGQMLKRFDYSFHKGIIAHIRQYVKEYYPDYRKNPYFKTNSRLIKTRTLLCDINPLLMLLYERVRSLYKRAGRVFR